MKKQIFEYLLQKLEEDIKKAKEELHTLFNNSAEEVNEFSYDITTRNKNLLNLEKCVTALHNKDLLTKTSNVVGNGTLIKTSSDDKLFYILPVLGGREFNINETRGLVLSPSSPIIQSLWGMKKGEKTSFRGKQVEILELY